MTIGLAIMVLSALMLSQVDLNSLVAILYPVAMVMTAMFSCSIYFTFRDSFVADEASV